MSRDIIPLDQMQRRMATAGRIRIGGKKGNRPTKLEAFRLTSHDREAIEQVAAIYGGTPRAWADGHGEQWEVYTEATELTVVLPSEPLHGPHYELWSGGGCQRRCDGVTASVFVDSRDDREERRVECICIAKDAMECSVKTRLSVILPDVRFGGTWRLDTGSWNAAEELPGMVEMLQFMQERTMVRGILGLEQRKSGKRHYAVPVLKVEASLDAIASGAVGPALQAPSRPALGGVGVDEGEPSAELGTGKPDEAAQPTSAGEAPTAEPAEVDRAALNRRAHATFGDAGWDYETQVKPALQNVYGRSLSQLTDEEVLKLCESLRSPDSRARFEEHMLVVEGS